MLFKKKKEIVYVVTGMTWEDHGDWMPSVCYPTFPQRMVFNSYRKARRFVNGIMKDIIQEALGMNYKWVKVINIIPMGRKKAYYVNLSNNKQIICTKFLFYLFF